MSDLEPYVEWQRRMNAAADSARCQLPDKTDALGYRVENGDCPCPACKLAYWWDGLDGEERGLLFAGMCGAGFSWKESGAAGAGGGAAPMETHEPASAVPPAPCPPAPLPVAGEVARSDPVARDGGGASPEVPCGSTPPPAAPSHSPEEWARQGFSRLIDAACAQARREGAVEMREACAEEVDAAADQDAVDLVELAAVLRALELPEVTR